MAKVRVELNRSGVRALLKSEEMEAFCAKKAESIRAKCGEGYASETNMEKNRVTAVVWPDTEEAWRDAAENNTILKALQ